MEIGDFVARSIRLARQQYQLQCRNDGATGDALAALDRLDGPCSVNPHPRLILFQRLEAQAYGKGFLMVSASPLTRSSYHAAEDFQRLREAREAQLAAAG